MHISMGMDSSVLVREAISATFFAAAISSALACFMPRIFFWFGQISTQTLNSMMVPSQAPMPITDTLLVKLKFSKVNADFRMPR